MPQLMNKDPSIRSVRVAVVVHVQGQQLQTTLTLIYGSALLPADADLIFFNPKSKYKG
jgi:hypothetical protein